MYFNGGWQQRITLFSYDSADRLVTVTYPGEEVVTQTYNDRGLPSTLSGTVAGNIVTSSTYNQLGLPSQLDLGNDGQGNAVLRSVFKYHGIDSLENGDPSSYWGKPYQIRTYKISDGTNRMNLKYWWDGAGNLSKRTDVMAADTESFTYDFLDQITGVSGPYSGVGCQ